MALKDASGNMEIETFVEKLQEWHANKVAQLRHITKNKDASLIFGDMEVDPSSDLATGVRVGVSLSLELLGTLPFSVERNDDSDIEDDGDYLDEEG